MKTVLIVTPFKNEVGGVEIVTSQLARMLESQSIHVDFLTLDEVSSQGAITKFLSKIWGPPYLTAKKYRQMKTDHYDAVICNGEYSLGINHKNAIVYFHGSYLGLRNSKKDLSFFHFATLSWRSWLQKKGSQGKKVVAVSRFLETILKDQGIKVNFIISNFVDPVQFFPMNVSKEQDFVFTGRFDEHAKGFDVLSKLSMNGLDITCYTDKSKPMSNLRFKPFIPNAELNSELNRYKVFISASRFESFGMGAAEALSAGLPILIGPVGFGLELQSEIPEFVVEDWSDVAVIKKRALDLLSNHEQYGKKAHAYALKTFSAEAFMKKWLEVLNA